MAIVMLGQQAISPSNLGRLESTVQFGLGLSGLRSVPRIEFENRQGQRGEQQDAIISLTTTVKRAEPSPRRRGDRRVGSVASGRPLCFLRFRLASNEGWHDTSRTTRELLVMKVSLQ